MADPIIVSMTSHGRTSGGYYDTISPPVLPKMRKSLSRAEVQVLHDQIETRSKALITLEDMETASRTIVRFSLCSRVGLGEAWKIVGNSPELGRFMPEIAPYMEWTNGDVWVLDVRLREGVHSFKAVLKRADRAYVYESGENRSLKVPADMLDDVVLSVNLEPQLPY
ncbi:hypothetical protein CEUSTIGMA_g7145.t1 [Chlamydomonas eustigma]|uniref:CBM20 domain-containing protein n=1 Tax=Chlamydomonas eustigma TaxID=1157962 RepID=A0A250X9E9_9CHLO|nr:hypothetical protein CEUSTIGMA_g7145.t1 [Chlamydomonas eustigma]|eukprot:GAX79704.1 hypothetical protein CEUSTIGMA_g7145.t1 [Chlamydomonas eustigma]